MLISLMQPCKSAINIYTYLSPPTRVFLPLPHPSPLGHHRAPGWTPCFIYSTCFILNVIIFSHHSFCDFSISNVVY